MADAAPTAAGSEQLANEVTIEEIGPALRRLTITIPAQAVAKQLNQSIGTLATDAVLPGFRRGRAPRRLLEKRFGSTVRDETRNRLIADALARAIEDHKISTVGEPEPTTPPESIRIEDGQPLQFVVEVEVAPGFELPELEGIKVAKPLLEITDEHVEERIGRQQLRFGQAVAVEEGFCKGDRLVGHATITAEGVEEPLVDADDLFMVCPGTEDGGRGPAFGLMIEGLAGKLKGKGVGDTVTVEVVGPEAHELEMYRGAKLTIAFRIDRAERLEPASIETLVEVFAVGTEKNLRDQMRMALQHQRDLEQASAMRDQVYRHLLDNVEMDLPEKLSAVQAARVVENTRLRMIEQGLPPEDVEATVAETRGASEAQARDSLKLFFLLHRLAEVLEITVSEQEVNGRISAMSAQQGLRPDQLRNELARTGRLGEVARMVRDQKVADRLLAKAAIEELSAEEWNKRLQASGKTGTTRKKKKTTKKRAAKT